MFEKKYIRYEYEAPKKFNFYLLWLLRYDVHKFVPVHGIDEDEDAKNHLACNAVHEFYWLGKLYSVWIRGSQKNLNFYLLYLLRYDVHKFVPVHGIDEDEDAKNYLACNAVHEFYWLGKL